MTSGEIREVPGLRPWASRVFRADKHVSFCTEGTFYFITSPNIGERVPEKVLDRLGGTGIFLVRGDIKIHGLQRQNSAASCSQLT